MDFHLLIRFSNICCLNNSFLHRTCFSMNPLYLYAVKSHCLSITNIPHCQSFTSAWISSLCHGLWSRDESDMGSLSSKAMCVKENCNQVQGKENIFHWLNQVSSLSNISNGGQGFVVAYVPHHATSKYCSTNLDILLHLQIGLESSTLTKYNFRIFLNIIKFNTNLMLNLGYLCKFYVKLGQFVCKLSFCLSSSHFQHLHYKSSWHWNNFCCSI